MPKLIDLSGNVYDKLTVLEKDPDYQKRNKLSNKKTYWKCQCSCGKIISKDGYELRKGRAKSCGHRQMEMSSSINLKDLTNQVFGRLIVLEKDKTRNTNHSCYWNCKCSCGNIVSVRGDCLKNRTTQSCGCFRKEQAKEALKKDLKGQRFGRLSVLEEGPKKNNQAGIFWKCLCDCGNVKNIASHSLISGATCSCGCLNSKGNLKIKKLLTENKVSFISEYSFKNLISPETGHVLYFDFAIFQNQKLSHLIEYDGSQHFLKEPKGYFSMELIEKIKKSDNLKNEYCKKNNIPLIRIPYTQFDKLTIQDLIPASSAFLVSAEPHP